MSEHDHGCQHDEVPGLKARPHCCPCSRDVEPDEVSRRGFLGGMGAAAALGSMALGGLSWGALAADQPELPEAPKRRPLVVKPVFLYSTYQKAPQTSWRAWGGIQTPQDVEKEIANIKAELEAIPKAADFPIRFLPLAAVRSASQLKESQDLASADAILAYAANGDINPITSFGKPVVFFIRHKSGPLYLWYEIISPAYLRQHTDNLLVKGVTDDDVVVDSQQEVLWRLRSLCGLVNTVGSRILAVGGPGGWANAKAPDLARAKWKLDIQTVDYNDLAKLIQSARQDQAAVALAKKRAADYLKLPETELKTDRAFVENAFLLEQIFRKLMAKANCRAITVNSCMGTIMPMSQTSACLALSTLNDDGWQAFCESDFVVIPSGMLATAISDRPPFFNDPTYPHDGIITLAHCTGPRKMDGKNPEPAILLSHFESDYGVSPKVNMKIGQKVTNIIPDFKSERWVGFLADIVAHPFLPICRCQIDVKYTFPDILLAERMPGFHWMTIYGDYMREIGYALRRIPIKWEVLG